MKKLDGRILSPFWHAIRGHSPVYSRRRDQTTRRNAIGIKSRKSERERVCKITQLLCRHFTLETAMGGIFLANEFSPTNCQHNHFPSILIFFFPFFSSSSSAYIDSGCSFNSFVSTRGEPFVLFEIPAWKHLRERQRAETGGRRKKKSDSFLPSPQRGAQIALRFCRFN